MSDVWTTLNDRQRAYLRALYDCDQASEAERRDRAARGFYDRTPAAEWRWVMYGPVAPPAPLYRTLHAARLVDPGTGATWQALQDRSLAQCRHVPDAFGVPLLEVQITPLGRNSRTRGALVGATRVHGRSVGTQRRARGVGAEGMGYSRLGIVHCDGIGPCALSFLNILA